MPRFLPPTLWDGYGVAVDSPQVTIPEPRWIMASAIARTPKRGLSLAERRPNFGRRPNLARLTDVRIIRREVASLKKQSLGVGVS